MSSEEESDIAILQRNAEALMEELLMKPSVSPLRCEKLIEKEGKVVLDASLKRNDIPSGTTLALLCVLIGSKNTINYLRAFKVICKSFCINEFFWSVQQELLRHAIISYLRMLFESDCYSPEDVHNCFEFLIPSLHKYFSMLPASLQLKLKILQREVDSFTTMLLDPDIGDDNRLKMIDDYNVQYPVDDFVMVVLNKLVPLLRKFRPLVAFNRYVEGKRNADPGRKRKLEAAKELLRNFKFIRFAETADTCNEKEDADSGREDITTDENSLNPRSPVKQISSNYFVAESVILGADKYSHSNNHNTSTEDVSSISSDDIDNSDEEIKKECTSDIWCEANCLYNYNQQAQEVSGRNVEEYSEESTYIQNMSSILNNDNEDDGNMEVLEGNQSFVIKSVLFTMINAVSGVMMNDEYSDDDSDTCPQIKIGALKQGKNEENSEKSRSWITSIYETVVRAV